MIQQKIKNKTDLVKILSKFKKEKKRVVFTNGCFDILHAGHTAYLEEAKKKGDFLVVAVNSDNSVKRIKGSARPIVNENDRLKIIASLESVDFVTIFSEDTPAEIIKELCPDIIVKGSDWKENEIVGADFIKKNGGSVITIPFLKGYSTTSLINKIKKL